MKNVNTASQITVYERCIFHDLAAGRIKFDRGPDLARGPDFGHACFRGNLLWDTIDDEIKCHLLLRNSKRK